MNKVVIEGNLKCSKSRYIGKQKKSPNEPLMNSSELYNICVRRIDNLNWFKTILNEEEQQ